MQQRLPSEVLFRQKLRKQQEKAAKRRAGSEAATRKLRSSKRGWHNCRERFAKARRLEPRGLRPFMLANHQHTGHVSIQCDRHGCNPANLASVFANHRSLFWASMSDIEKYCARSVPNRRNWKSHCALNEGMATLMKKHWFSTNRKMLQPYVN